MTAINLYLAPDAAHFFTDAGNYDAGTLELRHLGGKLFPLPQFDAALAWSGPSALIASLIPAIERANAESLPDLLLRLPEAVSELRCPVPFSVLLAGVAGDAAIGIAVQEGERSTMLAAGDSVKSIPSAIRFDPLDVVGSGLAMMRDQRFSGVVHGYCLLTVIRAGSLVSQVIERWDE
jgi:hypothetical protein